MTRPAWDDYFLDMADLVSTRSTCPRRHVGAVLVQDNRVLSTGYNGSNPGEPHCEDEGCILVDCYHTNTPHTDHCTRTIHAEMNILLELPPGRINPHSPSVLYINYPPCPDCQQALEREGIHCFVVRTANDQPILSR